jgi:hypothetical protein
MGFPLPLRRVAPARQAHIRPAAHEGMRDAGEVIAKRAQVPRYVDRRVHPLGHDRPRAWGRTRRKRSRSARRSRGKNREQARGYGDRQHGGDAVEPEKLPWLKFWVEAWRSDLGLRLCSAAARGVWIEMLCVMHHCEPYGVLADQNGKPMPPLDLAVLIGISLDVVTARSRSLNVARSSAATIKAASSRAACSATTTCAKCAPPQAPRAAGAPPKSVARVKQMLNLLLKQTVQQRSKQGEQQNASTSFALLVRLVGLRACARAVL